MRLHLAKEVAEVHSALKELHPALIWIEDWIQHTRHKTINFLLVRFKLTVQPKKENERAHKHRKSN